jgi:hypothetical protein
MLELVQVPVFWEGQNNPEYIRNLNEYLLLTKKYQTKQFGEFIGGMPVTLENNCFKPLLRTDSNNNFVYNITLKLDGERYLVFLNYSGELYFIDRSLNFYFFNINGNRFPRIDPTIVKPFLLDGELTSLYEFFLFDVLFFNEESFIEQNYHIRYDLLKHILINIFNDYPTEDLTFTIKKWFPITDIIKTNDIYEYIYQQTNKDRLKKYYLKADGLILQPFDTPYVIFGPWNKYNNIQFKWKPLNDQTMDFKIKIIKPNLWHLLTRSGYPFTMPGSGEPASYKPTEFAKEHFKDGDVAEFSFNKTIFKLVRARPNKTANSKDSIMSILNFIYNPFTLDFLKPMLETMIENNQNLKEVLMGYRQNDLILCALQKSLIFNKNEIENIKKIYNLFKLSNNLELEFRIIKKGKKDSNVDKSIFNYFLDFLLINYPVVVSHTIDTSTQKRDRSDPTFRSTYNSFEDILSGNSIINESKKQLKVYFSDQSVFFNLQFKLSLSEENSTNKVIGLTYDKTNNNIRIKHRYSFNIDGLWRIDATIVKSGYTIEDAKNKNETFEIECEYIGKIISDEKFIKSFSNLYMLILQNTSYC